MEEKEIIKYLEFLKEGKISNMEFIQFLKGFSYENLGNLKLDFHRKVRRGVPEAIFGSGKDINQLKKIIEEFDKKDEEIIITRIDEEKFNILNRTFDNIIYHKKAQVITSRKQPVEKFGGIVLVISAGSSDEGIAQEAFVCAKYLGNRVEKEYDVGVACISRVIDLKSRLDGCTVVIVVAGMEGALPSVVAGLTSTPVIAVPSSVGYGTSFGGVSALLSMLNSCAGGISVVNIDNGFGAAYQATLINQKMKNTR